MRDSASEVLPSANRPSNPVAEHPLMRKHIQKRLLRSVLSASSGRVLIAVFMPLANARSVGQDLISSRSSGVDEEKKAFSVLNLE